MSSLILSRRDLDFLLYEWLDVTRLTRRDRYAGHSRETFDAILDLSAQIATEQFAPHNRASDLQEPALEDGAVRILPDGTAFSVPTFIPNAAKVLAGGAGRFETNDPNYDQTFNGIEFSATKRLANKWMARIAAAWNNHTENYSGIPVVSDFQGNGVAAGNPTSIDTDPLFSGGQVAPRSAGSGFGDIFINAKWAINANALVQLPWDVDLAANLFGKQGTPFPLFASTALGQDGTQRVLVTPAVDYFRFKDLWDLDLRLQKTLRFGGRGNMVISLDLFNVFNSNTELNRQRNLRATTFDLLTDNLSPRILRLGLRVGF